MAALTACQIAGYVSDAAVILGGAGAVVESIFGDVAAAKLPTIVAFIGFVGHVLSGYCPGSGGSAPPSSGAPLAAAPAMA